MTTTYHGRCHCGAIEFDVETGEPITKAMECNCSRCRRVGWLLWFGPRAALRITQGQSATSTYLFHKKQLVHHFCPTCGIAPFSFGDDPKHGPSVAVNVRCLEGLDIYSLPSERFDGAAL